MTGGLLQLAKYGAQNAYLNGNPEMTYFKAVYKRHTNFSMEMIRIDFDGVQDLATTVNTQLRCKIARNGDLINKIYFAITLPDIYSSYYPNSVDATDMNNPTPTNIAFQWVPNLGSNIIKKCTLTIGGNKVSEIYGQWIEIWHEFFLDTAGKNNYDVMTGHAPEVFLPAHNGWNAGFYPSSSLNPDDDTNPDSDRYFFSEFKKNTYLQPPSIEGRQLYVPIPFWFTTNPGLALPLIALQYHDVYIEFECRPIIELYTLIETRDEGTVDIGVRTAPSETLLHHHIGNFITGIPSVNFTPPNEAGQGINYHDGQTNLQGWNMDTHILANYIFLDEEERRKFASNAHEYLIEQVNRSDFTGVTGTVALNLQFNHPVKYMVWCAQRNDVSELLNNHNNYTNWRDEFIPPYSAAYLKLFGEETEDPLFFQMNGDTIQENAGIFQVLDNTGSRSLIPNKFNFRYYHENAIKSSRLIFDGVERYSTRDAMYHRHLQSYQHNTKVDKSGLYTYSFSIDPGRYQPSGSCNFSRIASAHLEVEMTDVPPEADNAETYDFNVFVYAVNYNILRIVSGMAGLAYAN